RGGVRPRSGSSRGQLGGGGAHCTTRAAGRGAPGDRAVAGGGRAARHGRGVRVVPLGVPRRSERGGVSGGGSGAGGLAADRGGGEQGAVRSGGVLDRKSTRLNSSHVAISYAVFCLKKKKKQRASSRVTA